MRSSAIRYLLVGTLCMSGGIAFAVNLHVGTGRALLSAVNVPPCAQSTAAIALLTTPSKALQNKLNQGICNVLVPSGTWAKMDAVYVLSSDTATNARVNLVSSSFPLTVNGTMTFAAGYGYQGDGSTGFLSTAMTPSTAGGHYTQNSASFGVTVINNRTSLDGYAAMGAVTPNSINDFIVPFFTDGHSYGSITGGTNANAADTTAKGNYVVNRVSSGAITLYKNGSSFATASPTSAGLSTNPFVIGARYLSTATTKTNFSADNISFAFIGGGLTTSDVTALNTFANLFTTQFDAPLEVANNGFHTITFTDNLSTLATIDTAAACPTTMGSAVKWSMKNAWPNASLTSYQTAPASDPTGAVLNGAGSGTQLTKGGHFNLTTACADNSGVLHGQTFSGGGWFVASMNYDPTSALAADVIWPAFWSLGVCHLLGSGCAAGQVFYPELDFYEAFPTGTGTIQPLMGGHEWTIVNPTTITSNSTPAGTENVTLPNSPVLTTFHTYGTDWVSVPNGTSTVHRFFDNALISSASWTYSGAGCNSPTPAAPCTTAASPAFTPSNPVGVFHNIDNDAIFLILSSGPSTGWPVNVNNVTAMQKP